MRVVGECYVMCVVSVYMAGNSNDTKQKKVGMKVAADDKRDDCSSLIICTLVSISMFGTFLLSSQKQLES